MINSYELNFKHSSEDLELRKHYDKIILKCFNEKSL